MSEELDIKNTPIEGLTREEIDELKRQEAEEAPSTSYEDGAWCHNDSFTGVKLIYATREEFLKAAAERANLRAEDYADKRREALRYIATQKIFNFDDEVEGYVLGIVKDMGLSGYINQKRERAKQVTDIVYPIARRLIPNEVLRSFVNNPSAFRKMEGMHLQHKYIGMDGMTREYNAWVELNLPDVISVKDVHDEIDYIVSVNENFAYKLNMSIRGAHSAASRLRRKGYKMAMKLSSLKRSTYGEFANSYPVTFHNVCMFIEKFNVNEQVEKQAFAREEKADGILQG